MKHTKQITQSKICKMKYTKQNMQSEVWQSHEHQVKQLMQSKHKMLSKQCTACNAKHSIHNTQSKAHNTNNAKWSMYSEACHVKHTKQSFQY